MQSVKLNVYVLVRLVYSNTRVLSSMCIAAHFLIISLEVKASPPPHYVKNVVAVYNGMLPVIYLHSNKSSLCVSQISLRSHTAVTKMR